MNGGLTEDIPTNKGVRQGQQFLLCHVHVIVGYGQQRLAQNYHYKETRQFLTICER